MNAPKPSSIGATEIRAAHQLYCELTGQEIRLAYDRERGWYELLRAGYSLADVQRVIRYLQRQIRRDRRNVGALKLSNLLRLDQFEEDLNISRARFIPPPMGRIDVPLKNQPPTVVNAEEVEKRRQEVARELARFRNVN